MTSHSQNEIPIRGEDAAIGGGAVPAVGSAAVAVCHFGSLNGRAILGCPEPI